MFRKKKSEAMRENWRYCSHSCTAIAKNIKCAKSFDYTKNCIVCNNIIYIRKTLIKRSIFSKKLNVFVRPESSKYCSYPCAISYKNKYENPMSKKEVRDKITGSNSYLWEGGITDENKRLRKTYEYKQWRKLVYERDDYTCQGCKERGGTLNADHIKPFSIYPELRLDIDNGRTLCVKCHRKTDTWGGRAVTMRKLTQV